MSAMICSPCFRFLYFIWIHTALTICEESIMWGFKCCLSSFLFSIAVILCFILPKFLCSFCDCSKFIHIWRADRCLYWLFFSLGHRLNVLLTKLLLILSTQSSPVCPCVWLMFKTINILSVQDFSTSLLIVASYGWSFSALSLPTRHTHGFSKVMRPDSMFTWAREGSRGFLSRALQQGSWAKQLALFYTRGTIISPKDER